jgi:hypothetical protein
VVGAGVGRLWRFDGGVVLASGALSQVVGGGSAIAAAEALPLLFSTGQFRRAGRRSGGVRRPWRDGAAAPEAASSGG